jgi:hypothetical protein
VAVRETVAILFHGMFAVKGIISVLSTSFSSEIFTHPEHGQEKSGTNLARHKSFFARDKLSRVNFCNDILRINNEDRNVLNFILRNEAHSEVRVS